MNYENILYAVGSLQVTLMNSTIHTPVFVPYSSTSPQADAVIPESPRPQDFFNLSEFSSHEALPTGQDAEENAGSPEIADPLADTIGSAAISMLEEPAHSEPQCLDSEAISQDVVEQIVSTISSLSPDHRDSALRRLKEISMSVSPDVQDLIVATDSDKLLDFC